MVFRCCSGMPYLTATFQAELGQDIEAGCRLGAADLAVLGISMVGGKAIQNIVPCLRNGYQQEGGPMNKISRFLALGCASVFLLIFTVGHAQAAPPEGKGQKVKTVPLARTGQITSYAPGDDGDLQMGVPSPTPSPSLSP